MSNPKKISWSRRLKSVVPRQEQDPKKFKLPEWWWIPAFSLCCMVFLFALLFWQPWTPVTVDPIEQAASEAIAKQETNKDYRFYDLLPQQQVTPIPSRATQEKETPQPIKAQAASEHSDAEVPAQAQYILQIRSYETADEADARRAEILLSGLSAEIHIVSENQKIWYRVISGPYAGEANARQAQQILKNSGIDSILLSPNQNHP
ncbi:SPOR domain-containing protein [Acinetobacter sp. c2-A9]|uniref:SPOR domain-containing protein n=1 Tax=Acinetobacter sp. c2-A9 TaxID=3342802 RepID=UPI0035B866D9